MWAPQVDVSFAPRQGRHRLGRALALAVALSSAPALASPEGEVKEYAPCLHEPTAADVAGAKGAFQAGQVSFEEADYRRAVDYWEDAYRRDCTAHLLLLNLARAYELYGWRRHALVALETFLERAPEHADREKIERRIEVLRRQIAEDPDTQAQTVASPPGAKAAPPPEPPVATAPAPPVAPRPLEADAPSTPGTRPLLPLVVAGVGGTVALVGAILYVPALGDLHEVERKCPNHDCTRNPEPGLVDEANAIRTRVNVTGAIALGGTVVFGAGLAWYFLSPRSTGASTNAELTPVLAPRYAGLSYAGAF